MSVISKHDFRTIRNAPLTLLRPPALLALPSDVTASMADDSPPAPAVGCCTRRCCPGRAATNPEVLGFVWTRIGGTLNFIAILTLLPALSVLAKRQGGCHKFACGGEDDDMPCDDSGKEDGLWYCNLSDEPAALCSEARAGVARRGAYGARLLDRDGFD